MMARHRDLRGQDAGAGRRAAIRFSSPTVINLTAAKAGQEDRFSY
jgi:hypothetical protein